MYRIMIAFCRVFTILWLLGNLGGKATATTPVQDERPPKAPVAQTVDDSSKSDGSQSGGTKTESPGVVLAPAPVLMAARPNEKAEPTSVSPQVPEEESDADPGDTGERSSSSADSGNSVAPADAVPAEDGAAGAENPSPVEASAAEAVQQVDRPARQYLPLNEHAQFLRDRIVKCLQFYYQQKNLNTKQVSAWSVMHAALSFGVDSRVHRDGPQGSLVNALGWLCWNGTCRDRKMMEWKNEKLVVLEGPGFQGHPGQFLAVLAQCKVGRDFPLRVNGKELVVQDLVKREMESCRPDMELTFKLIGLSHYLASDAKWKNDQNDDWNIPRMIEIELASPLNGVACGGTHRLMGLSYAVRRREFRNEPLDGAWAAAKKRVVQYIDRTYALQNPDGSFSSQWYQRKADWGDTDRKLQTTGHMLEWLVYSLPDDQLDDPRAVRSVSFLTEHLINNRFYEWENGPRGHALRALMTYADRRFGLQVADYAPQVANQPRTKAQR
ncbi:MAG: hypothetical protein O3C60_04135 [Planctomycetota bacterium]|nr:hypothetical protein [Planctomycetota bacterium]